MSDLQSQAREQLARAFDHEAGDYLTRFCEHPSARIMRETSHRVFRRYARTGGQVLDLCCGPGPDFPLWQALGLEITGLDCSPGMLAEAQAIAPTARMLRLGLDQLPQLHETFDLVVSNFGGLNTVLDPAPLAQNLAALLPPGGYLMINLMTRLPLMEIVLGLLKRQHLCRRLRNGGISSLRVGDEQIVTRYHHPRAFYRYFAPHFKLVELVGLGIVLPPPYQPWTGAGSAALARLDAIAGKTPLLRQLGDHSLLVLQRS